MEYKAWESSRDIPVRQDTTFSTTIPEQQPSCILKYTILLQFTQIAFGSKIY